MPTLAQYDGLVIRSKFKIDDEFLSKALNLKVIGRVGAGMENIDVAAAKARGIECLNSPEGNRDAVGEHVIGMLLALFNNLVRADSQVRRGIWEREGNRGIELRGKTVGIVGFGNMGRATAEKLQGFGCRIIAYDKYKSFYAPNYVEEVTMEELQSQSDIISLHLPYTAETRAMVDRAFLERCRRGVYLVNTSRGAIVRTWDLADALRDGIVRGACLDVLESEKVSFEDLGATPPELQWLFESDRVLLSPHIAGWTAESNVKLAEILAKKIINYLNSKTN